MNKTLHKIILLQCHSLKVCTSFVTKISINISIMCIQNKKHQNQHQYNYYQHLLFSIYEQTSLPLIAFLNLHICMLTCYFKQIIMYNDHLISIQSALTNFFYQDHHQNNNNQKTKYRYLQMPCAAHNVST